MAESTSYTTSLSTDTLYWDPHSDASAANSRHQSTKSRQSFGDAQTAVAIPNTATKSHHHHHHHHRYHHVRATTAAQTVNQSNIKPHANVYATTSMPMQAHMQCIQQKPKSWDNIAVKAIAGYAIGTESKGTMTLTNADVRQIQNICASRQRFPNSATSIETLTANQQRHSIPRKNAFGRYSTLDIENYAPPPSQFIQGFATTSTTTTITKSTENLLAAYNVSDSSINSHCDCTAIETQNKILRQNSQPNECHGYYSHLPNTSIVSSASQTTGHNNNNNNNTSIKNTVVANGKAEGNNVATISEITRL